MRFGDFDDEFIESFVQEGKCDSDGVFCVGDEDAGNAVGCGSRVNVSDIGVFLY